jgi:hypothetical protein
LSLIHFGSVVGKTFVKLWPILIFYFINFTIIEKYNKDWRYMVNRTWVPCEDQPSRYFMTVKYTQLREKCIIFEVLMSYATKEYAIIQWLHCDENSKWLIRYFSKAILICFFLEIFNNVWYTNYPPNDVKFHNDFLKKLLQLLEISYSNLSTHVFVVCWPNTHAWFYNFDARYRKTVVRIW